MKKLFVMLAGVFFAFTSQAETVQDLLNVNVTSKPASLTLSDPDSYEAEDITGYEGRNKNRSE